MTDSRRLLAALQSRRVRFFYQPRQLFLFAATLWGVAAITVATSPIYDPDVWWVAAAGRQLIETGEVPQHNLFSYTEPQHPWVMHEWLLGPVYAWGLRLLGPPFFVATALVSLGLGLWLLLRGTYERTRHPSAGLLLACLAIACFGGRWLSARPSGIALLFPILVCLIAFAERFSLRSLIAVVLLELCWANTHGSFPLGIVLLLASALDRRSDRRLRWLATALASLVTFANPYGLRLHEFVYNYSVGQRGIYREIHHNIDEFRSIVGAWGFTSGPIEVLGLVAIGGLSTYACFGRRYRIRGILCLSLIGGALLQARHIELAGLVGCLLLAPSFDALWTEPALNENKRTTLSAVLVTVVLGLGTVPFIARWSSAEPGSWTAAGKPFESALDAVADGARLYVPFSQAGLAIWYGFQRDIRIFYDPRNDCYTAETFRSFMALGERETPAREALSILERTRTNAAVVPADHPLNSLLAKDPGWFLKRDSGPWRLFARRDKKRDKNRAGSPP